jgi:hypothetical protein
MTPEQTEARASKQRALKRAKERRRSKALIPNNATQRRAARLLKYPPKPAESTPQE